MVIALLLRYFSSYFLYWEYRLKILGVHLTLNILAQPDRRDLCFQQLPCYFRAPSLGLWPLQSKVVCVARSLEASLTGVCRTQRERGVSITIHLSIK